MLRLIQFWLDDARSAPDTRHVDTCDGLRAAAVLLVGWFHIWQQSWLFPSVKIMGEYVSFDPLVRSGYIWVDMMILISGFCLYLPWARDEQAMPNAADFYVKRLARVEPSYLLALGVAFAVAAATEGLSSRLWGDLAAHLTYTQTFFYWTYYATNLGGTLWTLAIEMEFYLLFPWIARQFRKAPAMTFIAMVSTALAFRFWTEMNFDDVSMLFNQLPAFLDTFAFGMLAAKIHVEVSKRRHGALSRIVCSLGCVVVVLALWRVAAAQSRSSGTIAIRLGQMHRRMIIESLGLLLLVLSANAGLIVRSLLSNPLTRFVSAVSMQFYIWHQTLAVWILKLGIVPSSYEHPNYDGDHRWQLIYTAVCFVVPLALGAALTYGFERPIARRILMRWNGRRRKEKKK